MVLVPVPGSDRGLLLSTMRRVAAGVTSVRGSSPPADERLQEYLFWCNSAVQQLGNMLRPADLHRLVLTRRYWLLQGLQLHQSAAVVRVVNIELDERAEAFRRETEELAEQIKLWTQAGIVVVPDTSFFIEHPEKLEDADIADIIRARGTPLRLVVPIVVVDELDKLKQHGKQQVRYRAGYTLAVLDRVLSNGYSPARLREADRSALDSGGIPRGEITVQVLLDDPGHRRLPINDDEIVDRALVVRSLTGRQNIHLITYDTGMALRAKAHDLDVHKLARPTT